MNENDKNHLKPSKEDTVQYICSLKISSKNIDKSRDEKETKKPNKILYITIIKLPFLEFNFLKIINAIIEGTKEIMRKKVNEIQLENIKLPTKDITKDMETE
ncbi:hypothetical protein [Gracilibacillus sp. YIM 98692]|uniref:hypothetical protein n=1 Tax=Gracilibacillus sp. YIM 98692 TaxID=2663532 RepID=UPI0013D2B862|nr:hypothetical protein [Gracilibacillus sp. YIM 98692]